jgi:putative transposase
MVTAGTLRKLPIFNSKRRLDFLRTTLFGRAKHHGIALQAWAIFPNHYHFVAAFEKISDLRDLVRALHSITAKAANAADGAAGRKVWFQYWETRITFERSYFGRLHYVHQNAVHHGLVRTASSYEWCSARWFDRKSTAAFRKMVLGFPCDSLNVRDDFSVEATPYLSG